MVSHEWQGYRRAMQILSPFGYSEHFVQHVLQKGQQWCQKEINGNSTASTHHLDECLGDKRRSNPGSTTIAVRGATIARPEGYCLCWELPTPDSLQQVVKWSRSNKNKNEDMVQTIKLQERQRKLRQWKEWRRQLQLTVLPQVLARSLPHSNACVQFLNSDEKHAVRFMTPQFDCGPIGEPVTILVVGIATEDGCFCSGLQNRFELGHLYPNSALMELSEMSPICMAVDTISAANSSAPPKMRTPQATPTTTIKTPLEQHLLSDDDSEEDSDDDYGDDSSSELAGSPSHPNPTKKRGWLNNCTCAFQDKSDPMGFAATETSSKNGENHENMSSDPSAMREESQTMRLDEEESDANDDAEAERILRGSRVPGMWHCYCAVFDGKEYSTLRVDGVPEVLEYGDQYLSNTGRRRSDDTDSSHANDMSAYIADNNKRFRRPRALLDGLTIGSDHCFDMTLCFGQGSGGEGEGAIAELVVFSGRLDIHDLEVLERGLMTKHGIPNPMVSREALVKEDEWIRKSTALYCQTPAESAAYHLRHQDDAALGFEQNSVPLRIMTKHRSVAWHQFNPVTGEELRIKRIGSRSAGSSSDW